METKMFDTLLELPLFQGLSRDDLTRILESTHLDFYTQKKGSTLFRQDESCTGLTFVIEGTIRQNTLSADHTWSVDEQLGARSLIGLDVLYGSTRTHRHTYTALCNTRLVHIDKRTAGALTGYFEVFRLNVLNRLTTQAIRQTQARWLPPVSSLDGRIAAFMRQHVERPAGPKTFHISQQLLGEYLGEEYHSVGRAITRMEQKGLLTKGHRYIDIPAFETLINYDDHRTK